MPQTNSTVEERIVEMRFDNKQFESGVKQTMSTLDRLKEKLVFKNDTKGIDNIQNSLNRIDLSVAMRGIDAFQQKLTGLQIFGKRIIENLADDFYGAIKRVESSIRGVFQQISTGGANRALNIEQAKFQLEGLHIAWEDIKGDIDYAVSGTAYGLDAAAKVAAQLSASQIQVGDDMKAALRGISGVAAMTNSSYEDIGRVFTQVAGAGRLYTQDMLQLSSRGLNVAAALGRQLGKTESEIREMVTKGQIDFKTFSTAMNEAFGEQATKANNTYTGSLSNVKAALSRIGADIKAGHFETLRLVFVDLIAKLNEFKKAFKPVENVIIEVESAVGRLIQKVISMIDVTALVQRLARPIERIGKKILNIVDTVTLALEKVNRPLKTVENVGKAAFLAGEKMKFMTGQAEKVKAALSGVGNEGNKLSKELQAAKDIWFKGMYGNGQARIDALTAAGIDPDKTQAIIEEIIKNGGDWDAAVKKVAEDMSEASDESSKKADKLAKHVETLAAIFTNIKRTVKAVTTSIRNVVSVLFKSITGSVEKFSIGDAIIKITGKIADLAEQFTITKEKAEKLKKPMNIILTVIKTIVKAGVGVIKFFGNLVVNISKLIYSLGKVVYESETFQSFVSALGSGIKRLGDGIKDFVRVLKESEGIKKFVAVLKTIGSVIISIAATAIIKIVNAIGWAMPKIGEFLGKIGDFFSKMFVGVVSVGKTIKDFFKDIIDSIKTGHFVEELKSKFDFFSAPDSSDSTSESIFAKAVGFVKSTIFKLANKLKELSVNDILEAVKDVISVGALLETMRLIKSITAILDKLPKFMGSIKKVIDSTAKVNKSIARLNNAKAFAQIGKVFVSFAGSITLIMLTVTNTAKYIASSQQNAEAFHVALDGVKSVMAKLAKDILAVILAVKLVDLAMSIFTSKSKFHVPMLLQFAAFMFSIELAIKEVIRGIKDLANMDEATLKIGGERLKSIAASIGIFFISISAIMSVINKLLGGSGGEQATKGMYAMSLVLIAMAISIDALMLAISFMSMMISGYGSGVVETAVKYIDRILWTIMGLLSVLLIAGAVFGDNNPDQDMAKMFAGLALLFASIAVAMNFIMIAINDLTLSLKTMPSETIAAFSMVFFFITSVLVAMGYLTSKAEKIEPKVIWALVTMFVAVGAMTTIVSNIAVGIKSDRQLYSLVGTLSAMTLVITAMGYLVRNIGTDNLKAKNILSTSAVFASLGVVIASLYFLTKQPVENIAAAMLGLSLVVMTMSTLMKYIGESKPNTKAILALSISFVGLATLLVPLALLKGEDWPGYLAAMGGLTGVVLAFAAVMKLMDSSMTAGKMIATAGAISIMTVAMSALAAVMGYMSTIVDIDKFTKIAIVIGALATVFTLLGMALSKAPVAIAAIAAVAGAIVLIGGAITIVIFAIGELMKNFPDLMKNLQEFAYTLGTLPGFIIKGLKDGLAEAFPTISKLIRKLIGDDVIAPAEDELGIASPSKVFKAIGNFVGQGFEGGIKESFSKMDLSAVTGVGEKIKNALPDLGNLGSLAGGDFMNGLSDKLNIDNFDTEKFKMPGLGKAITDNVAESLRGVDFTSLYTIPDLLADPSKYELLKNAGETKLTAAYEALKAHDEFLAKYPTFDSWFADKSNFSEEWLQVYYDADEEHRKKMEDASRQNYIDLSKLNDEVGRYMTNWEEYRDKVINPPSPQNISQYVQQLQKAKSDAINDTTNNDLNTAIVNMKVQDEDGNTLTKGVQSLFGSGKADINLDYDNSSVKTNMDAVSGDITNAINAQTTKLETRLTAIETKVGTFDTNQMNRTSNLLSRVSQLESAIRSMQLRLDTGALVGQLVVPMDDALGQRAVRKARG